MLVDVRYRHPTAALCPSPARDKRVHVGMPIREVGSEVAGRVTVELEQVPAAAALDALCALASFKWCLWSAGGAAAIRVDAVEATSPN